MSIGYVVNQTHWDREWYFTNSDSLILSAEVFSDILDELEKNNKANFCLDAQSSILEEYLELFPEKRERIICLVKKKQLFIGPWYTQSDCLLVDGESLIRNAMIGVNDCKKYGGFMKIGYVPDSFGFNSQIPMIFNTIGINNIIFWRGIDFNSQVSTPYFIWKGLGQKVIYAINMPLGYGCAPNMKTTQKYVSDRLDGYIDFVNQFKKQDEILVPVGGDQQGIVKEIDIKLKKINRKSKNIYKISSFPEFLKIIEKKKNLPVYEGEFRLPAYARVHRTISSVRMDIKQENYRTEQKLLKRLEPLYVLAKKYGIELSNELLKKTWKKTLASQAHDSIGGCVYDNVATDILHRYKEANEMIDGIENVITRKMAIKLNLKEDQVLLINTQSYKRKKFYKIKVLSKSKKISFKNIEKAYIVKEKKYEKRSNILIEKPEGKFYLDEDEYYELEVLIKTTVRGLGYKVLTFEESDEELPQWKFQSKGDSVSISNNNFKISFHDGKINAKYENEYISDFIKLVDCANDGDTYDFSPLIGDREIDLPFQFAEKEEVGEFKKLIIHGATSLPLDLKDRQNVNGETKMMTYKIVIILSEENTVDGRLVIDNNILSHRIRMVFSPKIKKANVYAGVTSGFNKNNNLDISDDKNYTEYPSPINIFDKTVSIGNKNKTFTFYGEALKEYEFFNDKLFITIFSSTGELGKPNLLWRPGRASGDTTNQGHVMQSTPLAQFLGTKIFDFHFEMNSFEFNDYYIAKQESKLSEQTVSYQKQSLNHFIYRLDNKIQNRNEVLISDVNNGILNIESELVNAIYPSYYDTDKYIIRLSNPTSKSIKVNPQNFKNPIIINALEERVEQKFEIDSYGLLTIKVNY